MKFEVSKYVVNGGKEVLGRACTIKEVVELIKSNKAYTELTEDGKRNVLELSIITEFCQNPHVSFVASSLDDHDENDFLEYVVEDPMFTSMLKYIESLEKIRKGAIYRFLDYLSNDPKMLESPTVYSTIINKINEAVNNCKDEPVDGSELYNLFDNLVNGGLILFVDDIPNLSYEEWKDAREIATRLVGELKQEAEYMAYLIKQEDNNK